ATRGRLGQGVACDGGGRVHRRGLRRGCHPEHIEDGKNNRGEGGARKGRRGKARTGRRPGHCPGHQDSRDQETAGQEGLTKEREACTKEPRSCTPWTPSRSGRMSRRCLLAP